METSKKTKDKSGLGIPKNPISGITPGNNKIFTGQRASDNYHKNLNTKYAQSNLGKKSTKSKEEEEKLKAKIGDLIKNFNFSKNPLMDQKKKGGKKNMNESAIYKIDKLLEEYSKRTYENGITPASGPLGDGKGVPHTNQSNQLLASYKNSVQAKIDDERQDEIADNKAVQNIKPGTEMSALAKTSGHRMAYRPLEAAAKDKNASAHLLNAQNKERELADDQGDE
jgi:hypothetical protein